MGCGIGYGYLHRIPIRQVLQSKDIPEPPVIKPAVVNNVMVSWLFIAKYIHSWLSTLKSLNSM